VGRRGDLWKNDGEALRLILDSTFGGGRERERFQVSERE